MKYQEKIKLAEEGVNWITSGQPLRTYKEELLKKGHYQYDLDKVVPTIKKMLSDKHGAEFKAQLLSGELNSNRGNFSFLSQEDFEMIKELQIDEIIQESKQKVDNLMRAGMEEEKIIEEVSNEYFNDETANQYLDHYLKHNVKVSGNEKNNYLILGIGGVGLGLIATIYTMIHPTDGYTAIYYGLIAFGAINLYKAYSTRAAIERYSNRWNRR